MRSSAPGCEGSRKRPTRTINRIPSAEILSPMGAMEKIPSAGRLPRSSTSLATRKAGAPMIVIAVPSDAENESGISSFEAGMLRLRERFSVTGNITAVVVT